MTEAVRLAARLRRDLGTVHSYAALIGILVGAGIYRVVGEAFAQTGPSVLLGFAVLAPVIGATAVAYMVFASTPLGGAPGGEYAHISRTFGRHGLAFVTAWLKLIGYLGALAYLANVLADYLLQPWGPPAAGTRSVVACGALLFFYVVHVSGVRWFGRIQVGLCLVLAVSLAVLIGPGLFAIDPANYRGFFSGGAAGFLASLPMLFFAFAGFEALSHTAGEVRDSRRRLPAVYLWGIAATTLIFIAMAFVLVGVLPAGELATSPAPMADAAAVYLPAGGAVIVTLGALAAVATSLNATMIVPARLSIVLAEDGLIPRGLGVVHSSGTPRVGLTWTFAVAVALVLSGQVGVTLNIAVFALLLAYAVHSLALLRLPRANPQLYASAATRVPRVVQCIAATLSLLALGALLAVGVAGDVRRLASTTLAERYASGALTSVELAVVWSLLGVVLYRARHDTA